MEVALLQDKIEEVAQAESRYQQKKEAFELVRDEMNAASARLGDLRTELSKLLESEQVLGGKYKITENQGVAAK